MTVRIINADVLAGLAQLADSSVHCVVTSPPYWGLRDYGTGQWEGGDVECGHTIGRRGYDAGGTQDRSNGTSRDSLAGMDECRDCGARRIDNQIGLEPTLAEHIERLVGVFEQVRRVLRPDGVCFLNYGDSYATSASGWSAADKKAFGNDDRVFRDKPFSTVGNSLKAKDLCLIPERLSIALQDSGWWVRSRIIWHKNNPMPESANDRPTSSHEHVYMLTKNGAEPLFWVHERGKGGSRTRPEPDHIWTHKTTGEERTERPAGYDDDPMSWTRRNLWRGSAYWWDAEAVREPHARLWDETNGGQFAHPEKFPDGSAQKRGGKTYPLPNPAGRNLRNVWTIPSYPFSEAHFATFPPRLVETCLKAGCPEKVCADCGAPYVREVESSQELMQATNNTDKHAENTQWDKAKWPRTRKHTETLGFSPSCDCQAGTAAGTVLDPFGGSGTTGLVADRLSRNAILIELNSEYAAMARKRVEGDSPLFANVELGP